MISLNIHTEKYAAWDLLRIQSTTRGQYATTAAQPTQTAVSQAGRAQAQRIYCSTEGRARWQPAEQYNYWSTEKRAWLCLSVCVCVHARVEIDELQISAFPLTLCCIMTWTVYSGLYFFNTWLCHDTTHTCRSDNFIRASAESKRTTHSFLSTVSAHHWGVKLLDQ